jgi:DNA-directed RNA polymerase sigma subunit (sigma70/sigma32)
MPGELPPSRETDHKADSFKDYDYDVSHFPVLSDDREKELRQILKVAHGADVSETEKIAAQQARKELIEGNLRLVVHIINEHFDIPLKDVGISRESRPNF